MNVLRVILTVAFIFVCMALVVLVLMQEGKSAGLGAISGAAETLFLHGHIESILHQVADHFLSGSH